MQYHNLHTAIRCTVAAAVAVASLFLSGCMIGMLATYMVYKFDLVDEPGVHKIHWPDLVAYVLVFAAIVWFFKTVRRLTP